MIWYGSFGILSCRFRDGKVFDACSREVKAFPDIDHILHKLHDEGYKLAVASE
jgi:phosphoglycolate phosphatase-like HAD superfamily hydrolase